MPCIICFLLKNFSIGGGKRVKFTSHPIKNWVDRVRELEK